MAQASNPRYDAAPPGSSSYGAADGGITTSDTADGPVVGEYSLGVPACDVYNILSKYRQAVIDTARIMSELTIPSLIPPQGWKVGDKIPGNNQSKGARCVNNLAASLLFIAFPPNQPIMRLEAIEYEVQAEVDQDPELWAKMQIALGRLAEAHRVRLLSATTMLSAYSLAMKLLLVAGNCLWKHINLASPKVYDPWHYVCKRSSDGDPLLSIHKEDVAVVNLKDETRQWIYAHSATDLSKQPLWEQTVCIYSVCNLCEDANGDKCWEYWQEYEGVLIPGTEVETDYDDPPMLPLWMIPVYGQDWGRSYCEEYRGDLFTAEALSSGVNDGAALAALSLLFVDPAGRTSLKQIREARNLSTFSGKATDLSVFRAEKGADLNFAQSTMDKVEHRLSLAFLDDTSIQRMQERVTAEEIRRLGNALDKAMGGLYSELAQRTQRPIIMRFIHLNEEENPKLPKLPPKIVQVQVITGVDALGNSKEAQDLEDLAGAIEKFFPQAMRAGQEILDPPGWAMRYAAAKGIKPDGIIASKEQLAANAAANQQAQQKAMLMEKGTGPAVKGAMDNMSNLTNAVAQQQQQPPPQGA